MSIVMKLNDLASSFTPGQYDLIHHTSLYRLPWCWLLYMKLVLYTEMLTMYKRNSLGCDTTGVQLIPYKRFKNFFRTIVTESLIERDVWRRVNAHISGSSRQIFAYSSAASLYTLESNKTIWARSRSPNRIQNLALNWWRFRI